MAGCIVLITARLHWARPQKDYPAIKQMARAAHAGKLFNYNDKNWRLTGIILMRPSEHVYFPAIWRENATEL